MQAGNVGHVERHAASSTATARFFSSTQGQSRLRPCQLVARAVATPSTAARPKSSAASTSEKPAEPEFKLACPICLTTELELKRQGPYTAPLECKRCSRTFPAASGYVDLTPTSGRDLKVYQNTPWAGTEIFRSPLVSFAYERGWRQSFSWAGFPGEDFEYGIALNYLQPAYDQVLLDVSCGSGLFSRRFVRSGKFRGVIASDFSESMLRQAGQFFKQATELKASDYLLLRADVGRLPFQTGSVAGIHAGAALHCWPNPLLAIAEVARVLQPGGVFVASTFLKFSAPFGEQFGDDNVRFLNQLDPTSAGQSRAYRWWEETELRELCAAMGLVNFRCYRKNRFILLCAEKPQGGEEK